MPDKKEIVRFLEYIRDVLDTIKNHESILEFSNKLFKIAKEHQEYTKPIVFALAKVSESKYNDWMSLMTISNHLLRMTENHSELIDDIFYAQLKTSDNPNNGWGTIPETEEDGRTVSGNSLTTLSDNITDLAIKNPTTLAKKAISANIKISRHKDNNWASIDKISKNINRVVRADAELASEALKAQEVLSENKSSEHSLLAEISDNICRIVDAKPEIFMDAIEIQIKIFKRNKNTQSKQKICMNILKIAKREKDKEKYDALYEHIKNAVGKENMPKGF